MTANLFKIIICSLLLFVSCSAISQEEEIIVEEIVDEEVVDENVDRVTINLSDLDKLLNSNEIEVVISDYEIVSTELDNNFLIDKIFYSVYKITPKERISKKVYFYNCSFNLSDESPLVFSDWQLNKLNIVGCEFFSPIEFNYITHIGKYPFIIENCIFYDDVKFFGNAFPINNISFRQNVFNTGLWIDIPVINVAIDDCRFIVNPDKFSNRDEEKNHYQLIISDKTVDYLEITSNIFDNKKLTNVFSINLEAAEIGELIMINNQLQTINLSYAEVAKSLLIDSLIVEDYIGILNFDFPETNTNVPWYNLGGEKFSIFYTEESELVIPYQAKTDTELTDNLKYNDLMSAYTKFNTLYHNRGDINSANSSYVEIKDIETRKQAFTQKTNPSLNNLINYKLNVFLRFFSDYATNPGKSLIQSLWVILGFTVLYMFSFSRWDGMNYRYYLLQFNRFSKYITTNEPIDSVFTNEITLDNNDIQELRKKYQKEGKEMPRILKLFGGPLHFLGKFRYDIIPGLIKFFNFHPGSWNKIESKSKKFWSGALLLLISILFLIYVIIVKFFNSLLLSLNSFVVIGFGALPEEDEWFAMYLSIIEGIVGWFLLTIFTITLLSQVLQSA
ncbi:MAG: hypothetical protein HQ521_00855 [Bacteroidetes bacterium]|nr:hypothetical protein [Bacteroidota bacterium]